MFVMRRVTVLVGLGLVLSSVVSPDSAGPATASPAPAHPSQARSGASAAVTWNGWRGVAFDTALARAHRRIGGTLDRVATDGGCGDVLTTSTGTLDGNVYRHPHRVGDIRVASSIAYPLGIRGTMPASRAVKRAEASGYRFTTHRYGPMDGIYDYDNLLVGPHGHTLYFAYHTGSEQIDRLGLAVNAHVASEQLGINGC